MFHEAKTGPLKKILLLFNHTKVYISANIDLVMMLEIHIESQARRIMVKL